MSVKEALAPFFEAKLIGKLEIVLVEHLERMLGQELPKEARIAIALASKAPSHGHVCADLKTLPTLFRQEGKGSDASSLPFPKPDEAVGALKDCPLVRGRSETRPTPLVLDGSRLYLDRFFLDERLVYDAIMARLSVVEPLSNDEAKRLRALLDELFPANDPTQAEPRRAVATALLRKFLVLTGGPGTGKTTTVVKLLAALIEKEGPALKIQLVAPTGKAATRMAESIAQNLDKVPERLRQHLLKEPPTTLHRALGANPQNPTRFRHDADNPLPADVVVVDEASMVDLPMMARLFDALLPDARLILVGDREQLASVDAGAVLAELAGSQSMEGGISKGFAEELSKLVDVPAEIVREDLPPIANAVVVLRHSRRFAGEGGIGRLAKAIQSGDENVVDELPESETDGVRYVRIGRDKKKLAALIDEIAADYEKAIREGSPEAVLKGLSNIRVLCAHRRGELGVEGMNDAILNALRNRKNSVVRGRGPFFHGRVVMVTQNDHGQKLFNGDVGIILERNGKTLAYFENALDGKEPARLPDHETAYAMTIHKSQGSEFTHAVVVLPSEPSPIVTRELLYTGVTRAKERVTIVSTDEVIRAAVKETIKRASGLGDWLWRRERA